MISIVPKFFSFRNYFFWNSAPTESRARSKRGAAAGAPLTPCAAPTRVLPVTSRAGQRTENLLTKGETFFVGAIPPLLACLFCGGSIMSGRTHWRLPLAAALLWAATFALAPRPTVEAADDKKTPAKDDAVALKAAAALYEGIRVETLDNGLRVFMKPIPTSNVVTTMVCYKVGSSDEDLDHTGLSHYLEHLMFKGTDKIKPGDIDRITQRNGGANNAYTTEDLTNFHFDFASDRWEIALQIEADRMQNLRVDKEHEFDKEKGAVIQELARDEDQPWDLEQKAIVPLLFGKAAPYGHPVIGLTLHVEDATDKIIKAHYDKWYHPNNAVLVIVGGFDPDKAMEKVKKLFGPIPKANLPERKKVPEVKRDKPARLEFESKFDVARVLT